MLNARFTFPLTSLLLISGWVSTAAAQALPRVQDFYRQLITEPPSAQLPLLELSKVLDQIPTLGIQDAREAVTAVDAALRHDNINVRLAAAAAVPGIILRADSAELLKPYLGMIAGLLNDPDARLSGLALMGLAYQKPTPPPEVTALLLTFVQRTDRDTDLQARALWTLMKNSPDDPDVLVVAEHFASRPLDQPSRITLLDAIAVVPRNDRLSAIAIASMKDPSPGVRERAVYAVTRLGRAAIARVSLDLQRMMSTDAEPAVRAAADKALRVMVGEDPSTP
jgi:hypothetical protein